MGYSIKKRINAVLLYVNGIKLLVFIVYLLCLNSSPEYGVEVKMCCQFICNTIDQSDFCDGCYIIEGDFNFDLTRSTTDMRSSHMGRLYFQLMLSRVSSNYAGPFSFTYANESNNHYAWLDDICIGNSSKGVIKVTNVIVLLDEEENFSDHYPVKCEVSITGARVSNEKVNRNERYSYVRSQEAKINIMLIQVLGCKDG